MLSNQIGILRAAVAFFVLMGLALMAHAGAPSFDCTKARTSVEKMICSSHELSRLDRAMADAYRRALKTPYADEVRKYQREWIKKRNRCDDVICLRKDYMEHLASLMVVPDAGQSESTHKPAVDRTASFAKEAATPLAPGCANHSARTLSLVRGDASLLRLNHFIRLTYRTAVWLKDKKGDKQAVEKEQCAWEAKVNSCSSIGCLKPLFEDRLKYLSKSNLEASYEDPMAGGPCPEVKFIKNEADKEFCMKRLFGQYKFALGDGPYIETSAQKSFCKVFFHDFMSGGGSVKYIRPFVRTNNANSVELKRFNECEVFPKVLNMKCSGIRSYELPFISNGIKKRVNWIYVENCPAGPPSYYENVDLNSCKAIDKRPMNSMNEQKGLNAILNYKNRYYMLEIVGQQLIFVYPFVMGNELNSPYILCAWNWKKFAYQGMNK